VSNPPVIICLQGHSTGGHISVGHAVHPEDRETIEGGRDFAIQATKLGFAALALEQRAFGLREDRRPTTVRHARVPRFSDHYRCEHVAMTDLLLGRTLLGGRVHDVRRACDLIETLDGLDASRIAVMGNSGGGTVSWYSACIEPRIAALMPSCSFCPYGPSIGGIDHCADNFLPGALLDFDMPDLAGLIAPRPLVVVAGMKDHLFPIDAVRRGFETVSSIYSSANAPDRCALVEGAEGHRFYPDEAWPVFRRFTGW
jgi:dienelactone hydrolase